MCTLLSAQAPPRQRLSPAEGSLLPQEACAHACPLPPLATCQRRDVDRFTKRRRCLVCQACASAARRVRPNPHQPSPICQLSVAKPRRHGWAPRAPTRSDLMHSSCTQATRLPRAGYTQGEQPAGAGSDSGPWAAMAYLPPAPPLLHQSESKRKYIIQATEIIRCMRRLSLWAPETGVTRRSRPATRQQHRAN
jgi:hypothetical protein